LEWQPFVLVETLVAGTSFLQHSHPFSHLPLVQHLQSLQPHFSQQEHGALSQHAGLLTVHLQSTHSHFGTQGHALGETAGV
jgi:hypothetical protein